MKTCILVFGKISPVHKGHGKLFTEALKLLKSDIVNTELKIYVTDTDSKTKLPHDLKIQMIVDYYPQVEQYIQTDHESTLFGVLQKLDEEFDKIIIVSGSDRTEHFNSILQKYNNSLYWFDSIESVCAGSRSDNEYSSTNVRHSVIFGFYDKFISLMPLGSFGKHVKYWKQLQQHYGDHHGIV